MGADAENHNQAVGQAPRVLLKREMKQCVNHGVKAMAEEPTETIELSLWELTFSNCQLGSLHGTDINLLQVCDSLKAWSVYVVLSSGIRTCLWYLN